MSAAVMDSDYHHGMGSLYHGDHNRHSYPSLPNLQFNEPPVPPGSHTLPPIQSYRPAAVQHSGSYDQMSRSQPISQPSVGVGYGSYGISNAPYHTGVNHYSDTPSFQQQPGGHMSYASAYHSSPQGHLSDHRSMHAGAMSHAPSLPSSLATGPHQYQLSAGSEQDFRGGAHVVGSQGRRGILPSDEGRPMALNGGTNGAATQAKVPPAPAKDEDGKYPCPHCTKTYLHAKHLKRHLLRHTGDRPYSCALCSDTFSRSDILKRHFQKCSIRRGNPTGATHLSNSQSHLRRQQQARRAGSASAGDNSNVASAPHTPTSLTFSDGGMGTGTAAAATTTPGTLPKVNSVGLYDDGTSVGGPSAINRSAAGILAGQKAPSSQTSSGSTTPLSSRVQSHMPQTITPDSTHQRMNTYTPSNANRQGISQVPSSSGFDDGNFYWAQYPAAGGREQSGNTQLSSPAHNDESFKSNGNGKMHMPGMDQNGEMMNGWMGHVQ